MPEEQEICSNCFEEVDEEKVKDEGCCPDCGVNVSDCLGD